MPATTPPPIWIVSLPAPVRRLFLLLPVLLVLTGAFYTIRWCAGSTLAQNTSDPDLAVLAVRFSPDDPQTHFTLGKITESSLDENDLRTSLQEYEYAAVRLAPDDYRLWSILASAEDRAGSRSKAEQSYLQAEQLAPNYAMPRWSAGNFYLRQGQTDAAFPRLCSAAESMERLRGPVLDLLLSYENGDVNQMIGAVGARPALRLSLVQFLLDRRLPQAAAQVWSQLESSQRAASRAIGAGLATALAAAHQYHLARAIANEISPGNKIQPAELENRGFEDNVETEGTNLFGWKIGTGTEPQVALDGTQPHEGQRSLTMKFGSDVAASARDVSQLFVVEPKVKYRLKYFFRAQEVKGAATVHVQVLSALDGRVLAESTALAAGNSDWHGESLEFTSPGDGAVLRLGAVTCPVGACPVFGQYWYDDFELNQVETAADPQK